MEIVSFLVKLVFMAVFALIATLPIGVMVGALGMEFRKTLVISGTMALLLSAGAVFDWHVSLFKDSPKQMLDRLQLERKLATADLLEEKNSCQEMAVVSFEAGQVCRNALQASIKIHSERIAAIDEQMRVVMREIDATGLPRAK